MDGFRQNFVDCHMDGFRQKFVKFRQTVGSIVVPIVASTVELSKRPFNYRSNQLNPQFGRIGSIVGPIVGPTDHRWSNPYNWLDRVNATLNYASGIEINHRCVSARLSILGYFSGLQFQSGRPSSSQYFIKPG